MPLMPGAFHQHVTDLEARLDRMNAHLEKIAFAAVQERDPLIPEHQTWGFHVPSTIGWTQILPGQLNRLGVIQIVMVAAGAVTVQVGFGTSTGDARVFGADPNGGVISLGTNTGFAAATQWPSYMFATGRGQGLWINSTNGGATVDGYVTFVNVIDHRTASGY